MSEDKFKNTIWSAYAEGKQKWKEDGNYFTPEELVEMDKDDSITIHHPNQKVLDGN